MKKKKIPQTDAEIIRACEELAKILENEIKKFNEVKKSAVSADFWISTSWSKIR